MKKETKTGGSGKAATPASFRAYLARQPADVRATLEKLIIAVRAVLPDAEEGVSYGMPAFRYRGRPLAGFAAFTAHCSYFPMSGAVVDTHRADLEGYVTSKGAVQFTVGKPLPAALIGKLVKARIAEIDGKT
jgi:uncharacterized protein YdhG (YjbR/CyaY superfamily)